MDGTKMISEFRTEELARITTPALLVDLRRLEGNIQLMASLAERHGLSLRPHVKAHKCREIAHRQMAAGAIGVSCATLQEAEVMAGAGIESMLLTTPVAGAPALKRIVGLNGRISEFLVTVDNPDWVKELDDASRASGKRQSVLIDVNVGQNRTGVTGSDAARHLAKFIRECPHLELKGIQAYYGHLQHVTSFDARVEATEAAREEIRSIVGALKEQGQVLDIISGGGTGTHLIDMEDGVFTEIQPGSYIFLDEQYAAVALHKKNSSPFKRALFVQGTVVSTNRPGRRVVDCGWKAFATEGDLPAVLWGGETYAFMGDEHGVVAGPSDTLAGLGEPVIFSPPHCDPTVNLFSAFHCIRGGKLDGTWSIEARGYGRGGSQ